MAGNATSVKSQGGILEGLNPTHYNAADPIVLFIIQVSDLPLSFKSMLIGGI
jgi:hypothetical protein